jgi:YYY domain-containing protein
MTAFISWYCLLVILGWITFPLAYRLFPNFADRGYSLARAAGLLIWGYIYWLLTSLGISQNDTGGILLALAIIIALSAWSTLAPHANAGVVNRKSEIVNFLKSNILFLSAFALLAFLRSANPEILGTEKPMELAFINAILRSPTFPPRDPWLSGYAISYYYFGYLLTAMLAKLTLVPGTLAFNLMLALVFALGALGAYGILYNLLALTVDHRPQTIDDPIVRRPSSIVPLLAPLFLLIVSNLEGFFHVLYTSGLIRSAAFWKWLDIKDLTEVPVPPYQWFPENFWWWWRASRVVQDYDLAGNAQEIIDEFPFFSFLLGDLHPHILAIPFGLLAVAVAFNIYLGASHATLRQAQGSALNLFGAKLHLSPIDFTFAALVLGGLAFLNTWDIIIAAALIIFSYILFRARADGWRWDRIEDLILFGFPLAVLAVLLYLPFYLGFSSQAGGILPNLVNPTRGAHLWTMFAPLFIPVIAYLFWFKDKPKVIWLRSAALVTGFLLLLWGISWLLAFIVQFKEPILVAQYLKSQGVQNIGEVFKAAFTRRLAYIGGLITLLVILIPALGYLLSTDHRPRTTDDYSSSIVYHPPSPNTFIFLLTFLASILILGPDFIYLRDQFGWRINTIFKFYYQAWMLLSLAAAFAVAMLLKNLRGITDVLFRIVIGLVLFASLIYPAFSVFNKTNNFKPGFDLTLDDFDRVKRENPDEASAILFLGSAPDGVISEAVGGSYSGYARISTYTGLQTVLGWPGHEGQWRGGYEEQGSRQDDIQLLYATAKWETASEILGKYNIRYVYIGSLERTTYSVQEEKFRAHLKMVFQQGNVTIYEAP